MTREEAIEELEKLKRYVEPRFYRDGYLVALDMAIESLSNYTTKKPNDEVEQKNDVVAEPTDLVSRADAIKAIESRQTEQWIDADVDYNNGLESAVAEIKALPSADRPSGAWVRKTDDLSYWYVCSQCGERPMCNRFSYKEERSDYCPNCGADMRGEKDD